MYKVIALTIALVTMVYMLLLWAMPLPKVAYPCPINKEFMSICGRIR
jgi:hypothetical protein